MSLVSKFFIALAITLAIGAGILLYVRNEVREARRERDAAARQLKKEDVSVTIAEGKRREEIAALMDAKGICPEVEFMAASANHEGKLFPDTYRFFPNTPAAEVVSTLTKQFAAKTASLSPTRDQLILASIVEREAVKDEERPLIAGIYANRMRIGMKLDADPTVQYAKDSLAISGGAAISSFSFWKPITVADYSGVKSSYNTYLQAGYPPGPIANPGLKSIAAAINPASHDFHYFQQRNGIIYPAKTVEEHNRNKLR